MLLGIGKQATPSFANLIFICVYPNFKRWTKKYKSRQLQQTDADKIVLLHELLCAVNTYNCFCNCFNSRVPSEIDGT